MVQTKRILFSAGLGVITLIILMVIINPFELDFTFTGLFAGNKTLNDTEPLLESLAETTSTTSVVVTTVMSTTTTVTTIPITTTPTATTSVSTTTTPERVADIIINEIMYNPSGSDTDNEWVEIYNEDDFDCNIDDWRLFEDDTNHDLTFKDSKIISADSYAVITNDATNFLENYPDFDGILIESTFSLLNNGEYIALKDYSLDIVDGVTYNRSWGGDGNRKTIEKCIDGWRESLADGGTPGYENTVFNYTTTIPSSTSTTTSTTTTTTTISETTSSTSTTTTTTTTPTHPYIGEIMHSPPDPLDEWVEIISATQVNMTNWNLTDEANHVYTFPLNFIFDGTVKVHTNTGVDNSTDLYWNRGQAVWNDHDTATLIDNEGTVIHQKNY